MKALSHIRFQTTIETNWAGEPVYFWIGEKTEVLVMRDPSQNNKLRIFQSLCPHMGAQLCYEETKKALRCPWHGLAFDANNLTSNHPRYQSLKELEGEIVGNQLLIYG